MTRQQDDHLLSTPLRRGWWTVSPIPQGTLHKVLDRAAGTVAEGLEWQGIAYTTAGARAVQEVSADATLRGTHSPDAADAEVPLGTVYELRLWTVLSESMRGSASLLARELRWLNGSDAVEVTISAGSASTTAQPSEGTQEPCWFRENTYLQHRADPSSTDGAMTSIEVFVEEQKYSNTVFIDELMTGRWI
ncbi:hypothetical protein [Actinomyces wuliandei]|uniref:hypothetical protein n=1 Tax=Actinomyces wuliandei TaxID=2057743 RepID=UPI00111B3208|nr:hypothetical protein [Actinomyces wuliandei]